MSSLPANSHSEIIGRMGATIKSGKHWYLALLEAVRDYPEDDYLISGEALDWISLIRMLVTEVGEDLISRTESAQFIKYGRPPLIITQPEAQQLIGELKYKLYLNYLYGVTVEAALIKAVSSEIEKEFISLGLCPPEDRESRAFLEIYESEMDSLYKLFLNDTDDSSLHANTKAEFSYWLFKYRLKKADKEKVASDTKKALDWLNTKSSTFPRLF